QFPEDDVQVGDDEEGYGEADAVDRGGPEPEGPDQGLDEARHGRLADPAEAQGSQRYPELARGQVGIEMPAHVAQDPARWPIGPGHGLGAGAAQLHDGELRRYEEAVEQHQEEREAQQYGLVRSVHWKHHGRTMRPRGRTRVSTGWSD